MAIDVWPQIEEAMKSKGWSQAALARTVRVTHSAVSKWKTRESVPDLETMVSLSRALGLSIDQLCGIRPVPILNTLGPIRSDERPVVEVWRDIPDSRPAILSVAKQFRKLSPKKDREQGEAGTTHTLKKK